MRRLFTVSLPFVVFVTLGGSFAVIVCQILQVMLTGWLPAAI